mgnify:CR=1 FL=1
MDKVDGNISTASEHKIHFDLESYSLIRAKIRMRWPKVDPTLCLCVGIPSKSKEDFHDVDYVQIAYGKVIKFLYMTRGKTFMTFPYTI